MYKASRGRFTYQRIPKWKHFDWSGMVNWAQEKAIHNYEVVTLLRDPIQRAISHFNFIKTQSWVSGGFHSKAIYRIHDFVYAKLHNWTPYL